MAAFGADRPFIRIRENDVATKVFQHECDGSSCRIRLAESSNIAAVVIVHLLVAVVGEHDLLGRFACLIYLVICNLEGVVYLLPLDAKSLL